MRSSVSVSAAPGTRTECLGRLLNEVRAPFLEITIMEDSRYALILACCGLLWFVRQLVEFILRLMGRPNGTNGALSNQIRQVIKQNGSLIDGQTEILRRLDDLHRWGLDRRKAHERAELIREVRDAKKSR